MSRLYPLVLVLQGYCIYHAYKHQKEFYWYLVILFLPILGSLVYLYINFGSKVNIDTVSETIKGVVNDNYSVEKLIKKADYSNTIANRIRLADSYASKGNYPPAISLYESCLQGFNSDDIKTKEKLMVAKYFQEDYNGVIKLGEDLNELPTFRNSESRIVYAWSLAYTNNPQKAEEIFKAMDINFSNYVHRSEYAKFLIDNDRTNDARDLLNTLEDEMEHMEPRERTQKRAILKEIRSLNKSLK